MSSTRKLPKSLSLSSVRSPKLKDIVMDDVAEASETLPHYFQKMTKYTLKIVNLQQFPDDFARFLTENLVDVDIKENLVKAEAINWCRTVKKLYPLKTRGDGNHLFHAVSLAMWGIHDSGAFLHTLVLSSLVNDRQNGGGRLFHRWKRFQANFNQSALERGIQFNIGEWEAEWKEVITSDIKRPSSKRQAIFDLLEDIHVFTLANIIRRPIIILSESHIKSVTGTAFCDKQFCGLYLPLLWPHNLCVKSPIVLGYANNQFTPLLGMEDGTDESSDIRLNVVPLVTKELESLHVHFLTEEEEKNAFLILKNYLIITEINWTRSDATIHFLPCAKLEYKKMENFDLMKDYILYMQKVFKEQKNSSDSYCFNWNDIDPDKQKTGFMKNLDLQLEETDRKTHTQSKRDCIESGSHEEKILSISTEDTKLCAKHRCQNMVSPKYVPYCFQHKMNFSNSTASVETVRSTLNKCMSELNIEKMPKRNGLNGKQEQLHAMSRPCEEIGCGFYGLEEWGNRCTEHRQRTESVSLKQPSASRDWHKCMSSSNTDCKSQGHSRYKGQCENCFLNACDRKAEELTDKEIQGILPGKHLAGKHQQCKHKDCKRITTLGYCSDHCILLYRRGDLNLPTQDDVLHYMDEMERTTKENESEREQVSSPGMAKDLDYLCSTMDCKGIKCKNPHGLCYECFDKGREKFGNKPDIQESVREIEEASTEDLVESLGPLSSSNGPDICHTPGCVNKGKQSYKGLCLNCYFTLSCQKSKMSKKRRNEKVPLLPIPSSPPPCKIPPNRCKTLGCAMFGTMLNMGYCSLCFSKYKELIKDQDRLKRLQCMSESEVMRQLPQDRTTLYPRPCITCERPGYPDYRGFCVECAGRRGMLCHPDPGVTSYYLRQRPMVATTNSSEVVALDTGEEYRQMMQEVERSSRTSQMKCKTQFCSNFANLKKDSYCNQCYVNIH